MICPRCKCDQAMVPGDRGSQFVPHSEYKMEKDEKTGEFIKTGPPIGRCLASSMTLMEAQKISRDQTPDPDFAKRRIKKPTTPAELYPGMKVVEPPRAKPVKFGVPVTQTD